MATRGRLTTPQGEPPRTRATILPPTVAATLVPVFQHHAVTSSRRVTLQDAVGEVLEAVVEFGGERVDGRFHHGVHQVLQLLLRHVHVEAVAEELDCGGARTEAGQLRAWGRRQIFVR